MSLAAVVILAVSCGANGGVEDAAAEPPAFEDILKIDAHAHIFDDAPEIAETLRRINVRVVNICFYGLRPEALVPLEAQAELLHAKYGPTLWHVSTFDLTRRHEPGYAGQVTAWLDQTFANGAQMVKIWKEVGMKAQEPDGSWLMPDAPVLDPIYAHLAKAGKPLVAHFADPLDAWRPLTDGSVHLKYYSNNPEWYMYDKEGVPSHGEIIAARDRIHEKHPDLVVVHAHLGSLEHDVDEVAKRMDQYPNFYVDVSARRPDLMHQPDEKVRAFFIKHQDRILYGTDLDPCHFPEPGPIPEEKLKAFVQNIERAYRNDYEYYARTLALPRVVLEKFYHGNAQRIMPDLAAE